MTNENKTICTFPFEMYSFDSQFGIWRPCPRVDYQKLEDDNFNNHDILKNLRKNLSNGVKDNLCQRCWDDEERGVKSYRQVLKQDCVSPFSTDEAITAPKILEIKFSNFCNLKCVFCSSLCSSLWEEDMPLPYKPLPRNESELWEKKIIGFMKDNFDTIEVIQLFGGEPVLHKGFFEVLDYVLSQGKSSSGKTISFSTNLFFGREVLNKLIDYTERLLAKGVKFFFRISIDGLGERGEYLRTGLNWNAFERNLKVFADKFGSNKSFGRIRCNIALNALNLIYLDEIMNYLIESNIDIIEPHYNYIGKPEKFSMRTFGKKLNYAYEKISNQDFKRFDRYKHHVLDLIGSMLHLEPDHNYINECQNWLNSYDKKRIDKRSFIEVFPENEYLFQ